MADQEIQGLPEGAVVRPIKPQTSQIEGLPEGATVRPLSQSSNGVPEGATVRPLSGDEQERYKLTHPEAGGLPGVSKPSIDVDPGYATIPVEERIHSFKKSYDEDKDVHDEKGNLVKSATPFKHAVEVAEDQGKGMLKNLAQVSAPGIATSVAKKLAPGAASRLPKVMTDNATPLDELPNQIVQNYTLGGGIEGVLPEEEPHAPQSVTENARPSSSSNGPSVGDVAKEYIQLKTDKLLGKLPGADIVKAVRNAKAKIQPLEGFGSSFTLDEAGKPTTIPNRPGVYALPNGDLVVADEEGTIIPIQERFPYGSREGDVQGPKEKWGQRIAPEAEKKSPLGRIDLSRLEPLLNESLGGKPLEPNVPLREQGNLEEGESLKVSSDPRKAVLQKAQARPEEIATILQRGGRIDPTSKLGLSRLAEHFGIDLGDSAISRSKAALKAGTHLAPSEVLQKIIDAGHTPADIARAISEGKHLPPVSGGSQGADHAPAFYSKAERVANEKVSTGSGDSMLSALRNNGVKESEIQWMGLDDFLKGKARVTKAELQDFIKDNKIELKDVDLGGSNAEQLKSLKKARDAAYVENNKIWADHLRRAPHSTELFNAMQEGDPHEVIDKMPEDLRDHASRFVVTDNLIHNYDAAIDKMSKGVAPTKYSSWTLPGEKSNYTEKLITLPEEGRAAELRAALDKAEEERKSYLEASRPVPGDVELSFQDAQKAVRQYANTIKPFKTAHFPEHSNVLAHVRFDDRTASDGAKVLLVEEAQSDWNQQGKKQGYRTETMSSLAQRVDRAYADYQDAMNTWDSLGDKKDRVSPEWNALREADRKLSEAKLAYNRGQNSVVPDAPFKTDWHELVMKRMLREAAEKGYDRLAWTTGDQQADRYDLSKHISKVEWHPNPQNADEGKLFAADSNGDPVMHNMMHKSEVENYIGKESAKKLLDAPTQYSETGRRQWKSLDGLDLKVGGEWAKNLYDRAIPRFLNKYTKKWAASVGETMLKATDRSDKAGVPYTPAQKVHSIEITPSMKKSLLEEGQPISKNEPQELAPRKKSALGRIELAA